MEVGKKSRKQSLSNKTKMKLEKEINNKSFEKSKLVFSYFNYEDGEKFEEIDTVVVTKGFNKNKYDENKYTLGIRITDEVDKILTEHEKALPVPKGWFLKSYTDRNDTKYPTKAIFLNVGPNAVVNIPKEDYDSVTKDTDVKVKFAAGAYYDETRKQYGVSLVVKELVFDLEQIKDVKDYFKE